MKTLKKLLICFIALSILPFGALNVTADDDSGDRFAMEDGIAVRTVVNGVAAQTAYVGDVISVQFWISGINPQSVTVPLSWDPAVVTVVDKTTEEAVTDGRKTESDMTAGNTGFIVGSKCYDMSTDDDYMPLYWNGRPVYTTGNEETSGGYPYLDSQNGLYRFFYFVLSPTRAQVPHMFLEVSFKAISEGDPRFHIATSADGNGHFDAASAEGIKAVFPADSDLDEADNIGIYTDRVEFPEFAVVKEEDVLDAPTLPPVTLNTPTAEAYKPKPTTAPKATVAPKATPKPTATANADATPAVSEAPAETTQPNGSNSSNGSSGGGSGSAAPTATANAVTAAAERTAEHMDGLWVYTEPSRCAAAVNKTSDGTDGCILPPGTLSEAINTAVSGSKAVLVSMPDTIPDTDEYKIKLYCSNLDDMYLAGLYMLYFETPYGLVGINPTALLQYAEDSSVITITVNPETDGFTIGTFIDGVKRDSFSAPVYRFIIPADGENPCAYAYSVFGTEEATTDQPLSVCRYYPEKGALVFLSQCGGHIAVREGTYAEFSDMTGFDWAKEDVRELSSRGIINGTGEGKFSPAAAVTRAQTAVMITRTFGVYADNPQTAFTDADGYYYPYIASANEAGIINGVSETEFCGSKNVTREDFAVMILRACEALGISLPEKEKNIKFTDDAQIADYAREAVTTLAGAGVINGRENGAFDPKGSASRAEAAKIIGSVYEYVRALM